MTFDYDRVKYVLISADASVVEGSAMLRQKRLPAGCSGPQDATFRYGTGQEIFVILTTSLYKIVR